MSVCSRVPSRPCQSSQNPDFQIRGPGTPCLCSPPLHEAQSLLPCSSILLLSVKPILALCVVRYNSKNSLQTQSKHVNNPSPPHLCWSAFCDHDIMPSANLGGEYNLAQGSGMTKQGVLAPLCLGWVQQQIKVGSLWSCAQQITSSLHKVKEGMQNHVGRST